MGVRRLGSLGSSERAARITPTRAAHICPLPNHSYEREKYYPDGNHPCPTNAYFSTWIPIVEDFVYNSVGQALGWWLYARVQKRRASHVVGGDGSICDDKEPLHAGGNTKSSDEEFSRMV